jgi:hypothetical protein
MSIDRVYYCEGPDCNGGDPTHVRTATPLPYLPLGFIETRECLNGGDYLHHFCSWDCLMKYAAAQPVPNTVELSE